MDTSLSEIIRVLEKPRKVFIKIVLIVPFYTWYTFPSMHFCMYLFYFET